MVDSNEMVHGYVDYYPGLEVVDPPSTLPQVYYPSGIEAVFPQKRSSEDGKQFISLHKFPVHVAETPDTGATAARERNRKRRRNIWIIVGVAMCIVVLAAVLVPVGLLILKSDEDNRAGPIPNSSVSNLASTSSSSSPTATTATTATATTATATVTANPNDPVLKGTRLVSMDPRTDGDIFLFYQSGDGDLRYISMSPMRIWQGTRDLHVTDAMLATPLATISTAVNGSTWWWLFYVDKHNIIQSVYSRSNPVTWERGTVGRMNYKVPSSSNIAFTLNRGIGFNEKANDMVGGLSLYASDTDGTLREYTWDDQKDIWHDGFIFNHTDGYGGATIWAAAAVSYLFTLGSGQSMQIWWRDYNDKRGSWNLGPSSHAAVMQNTSMCSLVGFAFQAPDGTVRGTSLANLHGNGSRVRWGTSYDISDGAAMNNTALGCWYNFPGPMGQMDMFHVFYQDDSGGLVEAIRDWGPDNHTVPGTWRYQSVPIHLDD